MYGVMFFGSLGPGMMTSGATNLALLRYIGSMSAHLQYIASQVLPPALGGCVLCVGYLIPTIPTECCLKWKHWKKSKPTS
jgi:hypothetical protein